MEKRYTGAIIGQGGLFKALKRAWASRFSKISVSIMIPSKGEKINLSIEYASSKEADRILVTRENWKTGDKYILHDSLIR